MNKIKDPFVPQPTPTPPPKRRRRRRDVGRKKEPLLRKTVIRVSKQDWLFNLTRSGARKKKSHCDESVVVVVMAVVVVIAVAVVVVVMAVVVVAVVFIVFVFLRNVLRPCLFFSCFKL